MADNRDDFIIAIRYALLKKGAKQKFSLFFLILLSLSVISLEKFSPSFMNPTRAMLNDIVYHISVISAQPAKLIVNTVKRTHEHFDVMRENEYLKKEIGFLQQQKFTNAYLASENQILKTALDFTEVERFDQSFSIAAKVILDQESPFLKSVLLNRGTKNSVKKGMSVFNKDYLIGIVIETNFLSSRVLLLTDLNSKIPVVIEGTDINAILGGTGNKLDLQLNYLPNKYLLEPNKIIFTSGKDGFLVAGIPVAETYLNKKNKVLIKLLADPDQALVVNLTNGQVKN